MKRIIYKAAANLKKIECDRRMTSSWSLLNNENHDVDINIGDIKMYGEVKKFINMANFNSVIYHLQKINILDIHQYH